MAGYLPDRAKSDEASSEVHLPAIALTDLIDTPRYRDLLARESYYRCTQHDHKQFSFDGYLISWGYDGLDIPTQDYIPMKRRQPSARMDLAKIIVDRLTAMVFGHERFPLLRIDGDPDAEDYVRALSTAAKLPVRMIEARNIGGACGTAVLSWGFTDGKPIIEVHQPAFVEVIEWQDYDGRRPGKVLKCYPYIRKAWEDGKPKEKKYFYVRYWDEHVDITWQAIPEELARLRGGWLSADRKEVFHECGICPVYWVQNLPDSSSVDGKSDYENQECGFDSIDILLSATNKGTVANVDATVVIRDDPGTNEGVVRTGNGYAIYSKQGADFLELKGTAIKTAQELIKDQRQYELDKASVVLMDPEKMSGSGISAAAMRTRYAPMLAKCDLLRDQYGAAMQQILADMLEAARKLSETKQDSEGKLYWSYVELPSKVEKIDGVTTTRERIPGESSDITLGWPPYFPATWQDRKDAAATLKTATGEQRVLSQETAISSIASLFNIVDVQAEQQRIREDEEARLEVARSAFAGGAPRIVAQTKKPDEGEENEE